MFKNDSFCYCHCTNLYVFYLDKLFYKHLNIEYNKKITIPHLWQNQIFINMYVIWK